MYKDLLELCFPLSYLASLSQSRFLFLWGGGNFAVHLQIFTFHIRSNQMLLSFCLSCQNKDLILKGNCRVNLKPNLITVMN